MESKTGAICVIVMVLGIGAVVLGFVAEATRVKKSQLKVIYVGFEPKCDYPSSPAMGVAIAAVAALVLASGIIISTTGGCCSCCQTIPNLTKLARVCIILSWITSSIAIILFLSGVTLRSKNGVKRKFNGEYYCYTVRSGIFSGAGIMGLVSVLLALVYYLFYVSAQNGASKTVELELEAPPIIDGKKPTVSLQKHQGTYINDNSTMNHR